MTSQKETIAQLELEIIQLKSVIDWLESELSKERQRVDTLEAGNARLVHTLSLFKLKLVEMFVENNRLRKELRG